MPRPWTVLPHRPLEKLQSNLWTVDADLPRGPLKRRMAIARFGDGRLLFLNAIALDEPSMKQLEAWGEPAFALAGNGYHRIDLGSYKARYPKLRVLAGPGARKRVGEITAVDGGVDLLPKDASVQVQAVPGTRMGESVAACSSGGQASLVFPGDVLMNAPPARGLPGLILHLVGFIGELRVPRLIRLFAVRDRAALKAELLRLAGTAGLQRVLTCHGPVVSQDAAGALRRAAETL